MPRTPIPQPGEDYGQPLGRIRRVLILLAFCIITLSLLAATGSAWRDHRAQQQLVRQELHILATAEEARTRQKLDMLASTLKNTSDTAVFQACLTDENPACLQGILTGIATDQSGFSSLFMLTPEGRVLASTAENPALGTNLANEDYFLAHKKPLIPGLYLGKPRQEAGQQQTIPLSLPCVDKRCILVVRLPPDFFDLPITPLLQGKQASGRFVFQGDALYPAALDTTSSLITRTDNAFTAWKKIGRWPLAVAISKPEPDIKNLWHGERLMILSITLLAIGGGLVMLWYMLRLLQRQEATESDLYLTKAAVERGADMAIWLDREGTFRYVNATACQRLSYSEAELLKMELKDLCPEIRMALWPRFWKRLHAHKHLFDEITLCTRTGEDFPVEVYSSFVVFKGQEYNCAVVRDVSERRRAEAATLKSEGQLRLALDASSTGLFDMPLDGRSRTTTSPEYDRLLGFDAGELIENFETWKEQLHPADRDMALETYRNYYIGKTAQFIIEYRRKLRSGEYRWFQSRGRFVDFDSQGRPLRLVGTLTDITERKLAEHKITELANLDAVTGLANRNLLRDELRAALGSASRRKRRMAVLFLDLDRFKTINDSLGHAAGDDVLAQVAGRLRQNVSKTDILSRLGGDEFIVVLTDIASPMEAGDLAERLLASFAEPFRLEAGEFAATTSIGISIYPDDTHDPEGLIRNADVAMYQAKAAGRNNYQFFTADMNTRASERLALETGLRQSLTNHEFELLFQPQVSLSDGQVIGAEALLRWRHPELGLVPPAKFIPVAEESRMIVQIGNWVLREACSLAAGWMIAGLPPITVAVNLSPLQLHQANLLDLVQQALIDSGLPPYCLELEVTESVVMQEGEHVMGMISGLKRLGVRLSVDDFGTGYSSLSYLKRFAFDKIKIDQSFVRDIHSDPNDAAIVLAIIGLGKTLGMAVLAEGVETQEQLDFLRHAHADAIQGYIFSQALTTTDFIALMKGDPTMEFVESGLGM